MSLLHGHSVGTGGRHGTKLTPTYRSWSNMIQRCTNPKNNRYKYYGGAGITVCQRWRKFSNFLADMGERPAEATLDRFPNRRGNYEPENCRWATYKQQWQNGGAFGRQVVPAARQSPERSNHGNR